MSACGDDDDPATSEMCKSVRKQYELAKLMIDRSRELGFPASDVDLRLFQSEHWECFH